MSFIIFLNLYYKKVLIQNNSLLFMKGSFNNKFYFKYFNRTLQMSLGMSSLKQVLRQQKVCSQHFMHLSVQFAFRSGLILLLNFRSQGGGGVVEIKNVHYIYSHICLKSYGDFKNLAEKYYS